MPCRKNSGFKYNKDFSHKTINDGAVVLLTRLCLKSYAQWILISFLRFKAFGQLPFPSILSTSLVKLLGNCPCQAFGRLPLLSVWATTLVKHLGDIPCQTFGRLPISNIWATSRVKLLGNCPCQAFWQLLLSSFWATALFKHLGNCPCQAFGQLPLSSFWVTAHVKHLGNCPCPALSLVLSQLKREKLWRCAISVKLSLNKSEIETNLRFVTSKSLQRRQQLLMNGSNPLHLHLLMLKYRFRLQLLVGTNPSKIPCF